MPALMTTTITSNFQVYLPEDIRKMMEITKSSRAYISVNEKKEIIVKPIVSKILAAAGSLSHLKPNKKIDIDNIRDYIDYSQW